MRQNNQLLMTIPIVLMCLSLAVSPVWPAVSDLDTQVKSKNIAAKSTVHKGRVDNTGGIGLNLRSKPWGQVQTVLKEDSALEIMGRQGDWYKVNAGGKTGYVHSDYVTPGKVSPPPVKKEKQFVKVPASTYLNVRSGPWGKIIGRANRGTAMQVLDQKGEWLKVSYQKETAWVHSDYMARQKPASDSGKTSEKFADQTGNKKDNPTKKPPVAGKGWGGKPVTGYITSNYGYRTDPFTKARKFHYGVDVGAGAGTPVYSLGPGKVIHAGWQAGGGGRVVMVRHDNGYTSIYAHLKGFGVRVGQRVGQGTRLGGVNSSGSSTGNHLHFSMQKNGRYVNPRSVKGVNL